MRNRCKDCNRTFKARQTSNNQCPKCTKRAERLESVKRNRIAERFSTRG